MNTPLKKFGPELDALCEVMAILRSETGCGWDRVQTLETLKPFLLEETHEVLEAIDALSQNSSAETIAEHREELGDLLLQVVYQTQIQRETGAFDMGDVCRTIREKLIRRHPHVFTDLPKVETGADNPYWNRVKAEEQQDKGKVLKTLDGIPQSLPALMRSQQIQKKASEAGFDWGTVSDTVAKIDEELAELKEALQQKDQKHIEHEIGDLLMSTTQLARWVNADAEQCLRGAISRFRGRFELVEAELVKDHLTFKDVSLNELLTRWQRAKKQLHLAIE